MGQKSEQSLINKIIKNSPVTGSIEFHREVANGKLLFCKIFTKKIPGQGNRYSSFCKWENDLPWFYFQLCCL
jgi:hypothetical protein